MNGDGLDNRQQNLAASRARLPENRRTVDKSKRGGSWVAAVRINKKMVCKRATSQVEGARIYDELATRHFGPFARLNGAV